MAYYSRFHEYIHQNLSGADQDSLPQLLNSPHRRTRLLKRPETATHNEALIFAELADVSVGYLLRKFKLGLKGMTDRERAFHLRLEKDMIGTEA